MAQNVKVPEFGNWDSGENVPYTQYFEKARKGRGTGKLINPNDPQQNPEAFHADAPASDAPVLDSKPKDAIGTSRDEDLHPTETRHDPASHRTTTDSPLHMYGNRPNHGDQRRKASRASGGFDNSADPSPLHPSAQAKAVNKDMSSPSKNSSESSAHSSSTPSRLRMKAKTSRGDETPERVSAVPKFGDWDESNPSTADSYTHIFNQVREEKKTGSAKVSMISDDTIYIPVQESNNKNSWCGCFNWFKKK